MPRSRKLVAGLLLAVGIVWWVLIAAVVLVAALLILIGAHGANGGLLKLDVFFEFPSGAYRVTAKALSGSPATIPGGSGQLAFAHPRPGFVAVAFVLVAVTAALWLFVVQQLRRLMVALAAGETFAPRNAVHLQRIGVAVIAFDLVHALVVWGGGLYLEHVLVAPGLTFTSHFGLDLPVLLLGVLLVVLSAAFRAGAEMAEEQALTV